MSRDDLDLSACIAVVGVAGRFPGAPTVAELWQNLLDGREAITHFSDEELLAAGVDRAVLDNPSYVKAGRILDDVELFDAGFFGYPPREAQILDPQQRLFLEQAWVVLEDAGIDPSRFEGAIGVFAGAAMSTYLMHNLATNPELAASVGVVQAVLGNDKDSLATRTAYALDLKGPCYTVQSYCSTSLVAVCHAATSLLTGECDAAIAGGVAISVPQRVGYFHQPGGMSSSDGRCRAFDHSAEGTPIANGVALVCLKRAEDAIADGDHVYSLIRGWAVNNDGAGKVGFTAPGVRGQAAVVAEALANAGVSPHDVGYVEAHGTGTLLGDATEVAALKRAFAGVREGSCALGSVKTNLGHLDRAAGVTGLIKASLMVRDGVMPPTINFERPNPELGLEGSPFFVNDRLRDWPDGPRLAGVSAFGIGGTNAHVVVSEPPPAAPAGAERRPQVLVVSARTEQAADEAVARLAAHVREHDLALGDVAWTLQAGRRAFEHRRAVVAPSAEEAARALSGEGGLLRGRVSGDERSVAFLLAGVGEHYPGMAGGLLEEPVFAEAFGECAQVLEPLTGVDLVEAVLRAPRASGGDPLARMLGRDGGGDIGVLARTVVAQPAVFAVEYALARLLETWGIRPAAMLGYSVGEYVAACLAGVLPLEQALALVAERARLIDALPAGAMLAVGASAGDLRGLLPSGVDVAAENGPAATVVSGAGEQVAELQAQLDARGIASRPLSTSHAFHSRMLAPTEAPLTAWARAHLDPQAPEIPYLSNVTGDWITDADVRDPGYWARHAVSPVRFHQGLQRLLADAQATLIELGPGQSLGAMTRTHPACDRDRWPHIHHTLPGRHDAGDDRTVLAQTVARLWLAGHDVDWRACNPGPHRRVALPTYPFQRQRYWIDAPRPAAAPAPDAEPEPQAAPRLHTLAWQQAPAQPGRVEGPVLLFEDRAGVAAQLRELLARDGADTVMVTAGEAFAADGDRVTLRPGADEDYAALAEWLREHERVPATVAHLWSVDGEPAAERSEELASRLELGFASAVRLARALDRVARGPLRIALVSDAMHAVADGDVSVPEKATLLGPCKVIPQEYPSLHCRSIDVRLGDEALAERLLAELSWPDGPPIVALRGDGRFVQALADAPEDGEPAVRLRRDGAYLVLGGLGGVGLLLARHLLADVGARVALTTRSAPPGRDDERLRELAGLDPEGDRLLVVQADVTDEASLRAAVARVREAFGGLDGVIHAAADTRPDSFRLLEHAEEAAWNRHFAAKLHGTLALERVLRDDPPAFVLLMSSISGVLGGLGFASYAAANLFLDAVPHRHRDEPARWLSVAWDTWAPTAASMEGGALGSAMLESSLSEEDAIDALHRTLALGLPHAVVAATDLDARMRKWLTSEGKSGGASAERFPRPDLPEPYVAPETPVERRLAEIWGDVLGIDGPGVTDNFFDLGGTSLLGLQLVDRIGREFESRLPVVALFEAPTIQTLARMLAEQGTPQAEPAAPAPAPAAGERVERREPAGRADHEDAVAIVGMSGRFPGAASVEALWSALLEGDELVRTLSDDELREVGVPEDLLDNPGYVKRRPVLDGVDRFDAGFFGCDERTAAVTDPQQRIFLEVSWEALEDAGYAGDDAALSVGVFASSNTSTYGMRFIREPGLLESSADLAALTGNDKDALATNVSYRLNLRGPSVGVQTYCSSSLVAVHYAVRSLLAGECDVAVAGGVSIMVPDRVGHLPDGRGQLTSDGHVRTFDAGATGGMYGDGAAVVVLRRLADAIESGDRIVAVIRGSAVNNDGAAKVDFRVGSVEGQAEVVRSALDRARVRPEDVSFVEAHGTGTLVGDAIEVAALKRAFAGVREGSCALGSVKTNLGHLDRAAGVTGLIKASLMVRDGVMPPTINFERPNPELGLEGSPFQVNSALREWPQGPRLAGVSAFGVGGTNAHVVVGEPPPVERAGSDARVPQVLVVSARTEQAADEAAARLAERLSRGDLALGDVAWTLQAGRRAFEHRRAVVAPSAEEAARALSGEGGLWTGRAPAAERSVAFLLAGVGEHYPGMAGALLEEPVFAEAFGDCARALEPLTGVDLVEAVLRAPRASGGDRLARMLGRDGGGDIGVLARTVVAQPAVFAVEYALARLLASWGIRPAAMLGYSVGEYVAACLAGVLPLEQALALVAERARLIDALPAGAMLAVGASTGDLRGLLPSGVDVAAENGPAATVVSGPSGAIDELQAQLAARGIASRPLSTSHAFHSRMLAPIEAPLTAWARAHLDPQAPHTPYVSNVTGDWITDADVRDPGYWARHAVSPVRFHQGLERLLADAQATLIELGPGQSLSAMARTHPACDRDRWPHIHHTLPGRHDRDGEHDVLAQTVARLWLAGHRIDWRAYNRGPHRRVALPTYPFQRQRYWIDTPKEAHV